MVIKTYDYEALFRPKSDRFVFQERKGYGAKLAAAQATVCPDTTKAGNACQGKPTDSGFCVGHSKARGLL
jgi:hypothetical protein